MQKSKDAPKLASALNPSPIQTHVMIPRIQKPKLEKILPKTYIITSAKGSCKGDCRDGLNQDLAGGPKLIYYTK